jgi:hypothetical protein
MQPETNATKTTLQELAEIRAQSKAQAKNGEVNAQENDDELPAGSTVIEERESEGQGTEEVAPVAAAAPAEEETLIRIGDKEFKTQREAIAYAEGLEQEKLIGGAYQQGVREALDAIRPPTPDVAPEEDNFEEKFYANPKQALAEIEERAVAKAEERLTQKQSYEKNWELFQERYPDIDRLDAERILRENIGTIGKITDRDVGMKELAKKTRAEYQRIIERTKPRTELPNRGGQAVSAGSGSTPSVTPQKKNETPLDFVTELKKMRRKA